MNTRFVRSKTVSAVNPDELTPFTSSKLLSVALTMLFPDSTPLIINGSLIWNNPVTSRRVTEVALFTIATAYPTDPLNLPFTWE